MPKCKKCGTNVSSAVKTWKLAPKGRKSITMGLFKCPACGSYFRTQAK